MFYLYRSESSEVLTHYLCALLQNHAVKNPFSTEHIIVPNEGVAHYLERRIACHLSVLVAVDFFLPCTYFDLFFLRKRGLFTEENARYACEMRRWKLVEILLYSIDEPDYTMLKTYLVGHSKEDIPIQDWIMKENGMHKLYQLVDKITCMFEYYLIYRPQWLLQWEAGKEVRGLGTAQCWIRCLWQQLCNTKEQERGWFSATEVLNYLRNMGDTRETSTEPLFVFSCETLPPLYLEMLQVMASVRDVHFLSLNPSTLYWGDIESHFLAQEQICFSNVFEAEEDNIFLRKWSKAGLYAHRFLCDLPMYETSCFVEHYKKEKISSETALSCVQRYIIHNKNINTALCLNNSEEDSITFHCHHSPVREVEALNFYLLKLFEKDDTIKPEDVLVAVPDLDSYRKIVSAVFDDNRLSFFFAEHEKLSVHEVVIGLLDILSIEQKEFSSKSMVSILNIAAIKRRWGFNSGSVQTIQQWISESNVKQDFNHLSEQYNDTLYVHTWEYGIDRILAGYAIGEADGLYEYICPLSNILESDAELCGCFIEFITCLKEIVPTEKELFLLPQWCDKVRKIVDVFFALSAEEELVIQRIRDILMCLEGASIDAPVTHATLLYWFKARIAEDRSFCFSHGGITIAALDSIYAVPFKVICLLGMNNHAFSRKEIVFDFDVDRKKKREAYSNIEDISRFIFLETVLSAREKLYISYCGSDRIENTSRSPSAPVADLLNGCMKLFDKDQAYWLTEHPLYHVDLVDYDKRMTTDHIVFSVMEYDTEDDRLSIARSSNPIRIRDLIQFYKNPYRFFLQKTLGIFIKRPYFIADYEPFTVHYLDKFLLQDKLLRLFLEKKSDNYIKQFCVLIGCFPLKYFGKKMITESLQPISDLAKYICMDSNALAKKSRHVLINRSIGTQSIIGSIFEPCLHYSAYYSKYQMLIPSFIQHLLQCFVNAVPEKSFLFYLEHHKTRIKPRRIQMMPVSHHESKNLLEKYIDFYQKGQYSALPFIPQISLPYAYSIDSTKEEPPVYRVEKQIKRILLHDPYADYVWKKNEDFLHEDFLSIVEQLVIPALAYCHEEEYEEKI